MANTFIFVKPSYHNIFEYYINDGELHSLSRENMEKFILSFVTGIDNFLCLEFCLDYKEPFIMDKDNNKIHKLSYIKNEKLLRKQLKDKNKQDFLNETKKDDFLKDTENLKEQNIKNFISSIANKNLTI